MTEYKDKYGNALTLIEWADLFQNMEYRKIGFEDLGIYRVSTVWMGMPLNIYYDNEYFETMVFPNDEKNKWSDIDMDRYETLEQAIAGHAAMVEKWKKMLKEGTQNE